MTIDIDHGWDDIRRELLKLRGSSVTVGIQADAGSDSDSTPVIKKAVINEFGSTDGRIPERSFVRASFDSHERDIQRRARQLYKAVLEGRLSARRSLDILGLYHTAQVKNYLNNLQAPPNAPSTVKQKGSSNPLVDTGQTRDSIRHEIDI